ncbi:MAG: transglycosylase SLT domain-containing protein [Iamia sp.]
MAVAPVEAADDPATHPHGGGTHMVTPGETLSGIAAANGTTVAALAAANGLSDPDLVVAATSLTLASGDGAVAPGPSAAPSAPSSSAGLPSRLQARPDRLAHRPLFARWAAANSVPLDLLEAMTWLESGWQNGLVSPDGAVGIGQLMPGTVEHMELLIGVDLDPYVVEDNIRMSARYLRWLLSRYGGDSGDALAAYYQGHASVARNGRFSDTQTYVENILALRNRF